MIARNESYCFIGAVEVCTSSEDEREDQFRRWDLDASIHLLVVRYRSRMVAFRLHGPPLCMPTVPSVDVLHPRMALFSSRVSLLS